MDYKLAHAVMRTLTYYDVMEYPMTEFEVWRHLICEEANTVWTLHDVRRILHDDFTRTYIDQRQGFYFLHGREGLVDERLKRQRISATKIKRLHRYIFVLRLVPFVRMIGLTGRLSMKNGQESSDLDVLVVAQAGRIWMCRIFVTAVTQVLGIRRHGKKQKDRICLNYYLNEDALEVPTKDLFGAHEYSFIIPLYGMDVFDEFVMANRWIRQYNPHYITDVLRSTWTVADHPTELFIRQVLEKCFGFERLEGWARTFQYAKIQKNPKTKLPGALIIANDKHLVFLPKPHGPRIYEEYRKRFGALELPWPSS